MCDERAAIPIGSYQQAFGVTLSLPTVVGRAGAVAVLHPELTPEERSKQRPCVIGRDAISTAAAAR
jgi:malate/lactate dehydrogenase